MDAFEVFEGFTDIETKLEASPNMHDSTLLGICIDQSTVVAEFADIDNLDGEKMCFTFLGANVTYFNLFQNFLKRNKQNVWDAKVGGAKNGKLKFSAWDANGNATGFPLLLEIEFDSAKVELKKDESLSKREFFDKMLISFNDYEKQPKNAK